MPARISSSMQADTSAAVTSILTVAQSIYSLLVIQFLLGLLMGFPSSHIPSLQDEVFGDKAFAIVGAFGGVKGILSLLTAPSIGYFSDAVGRREALVVALFLSLLPSIWVAVFDLFWGYYTTDALFGVYSGAMSVVMACVADQLQNAHDDENDVLIHSGDGLAASKREELDVGDNNNTSNPGAANAASNSSGSSGSTTSSSTLASSVSSSATAEELVKRTRAMSIAMASMGFGMICGAGFGTLLSYQNAFRCSLVAGVVNVCLVHWPMRVYLDRLTVIAQAGVKGGGGTSAANSASSAAASAASPTPASSSSSQQSNRSQNEEVRSNNHDDENDDEEYEDEDQHHSVDRKSQQKKHEKKSLISSPNTENNSEQRNQFVHQSQQAFNTIGISMARSQRTLKTFTGLRHLAGIVFCDSLVLQAMAILIPLFLKKYLLFTPGDQTVLMISLGISSAVGLLAIVPFITAKIKTMGMLRLALLADMIMVSLYSFVRSKFLAQILPLFTCVGVAMFPCASSLASEVMFGVSNVSEGLAQGIVSAARMFAEGVSPLILGGLLSLFDQTKYPGMPFLLVGVQELIALYLTLKLENFMNLPSAWRYEDPV